jgi:hypothetical protein
LEKAQFRDHILPLFTKALTDEIPNVRFCVAKMIVKYKSYIDQQMFTTSLAPALKTNWQNDQDPDVKYYSEQALK